MLKLKVAPPNPSPPFSSLPPAFSSPTAERAVQGPLFAVFFVFVVTLGLFPGVTVNISSQRQDALCWCVCAAALARAA